MLSSRPDLKWIAAALACALLTAAAQGSGQGVYNATGLPVYPNLHRAKMDEAAKTDALGHWCVRFAADTFDRLEIVQAWYRKALGGWSETDLSHDQNYKDYINLSGIKLARGIDSVTVYKTADPSITSIELFKCSSPK